MNRKTQISISIWLLAAGLGANMPGQAEAKSYGSGSGRSYSSSSRSSGGGSRNASSRSTAISSHHTSHGGDLHNSKPTSDPFQSGSGKSYSSGSTWSDETRRSYNSAKSYGSNFTFDKAAARARKEEASRQHFNQFKEGSARVARDPEGTLSTRVPPSSRTFSASASETPTPVAEGSSRVSPPRLPDSATGSYRPTYVPDAETLLTRPARHYGLFAPYLSRPVVRYRDPFSSFFWWWLLDRSLDDRAQWAYHHRYDMDPARYQSLVATNQELSERVAQLEAQQLPRNPNYAPAGLDHDLMYSDRHVAQSFQNRPTASGRLAFWILCLLAVLGAGYFFIWIIFLKRWQPAAAS